MVVIGLEHENSHFQLVMLNGIALDFMVDSIIFQRWQIIDCLKRKLSLIGL